MTTCVLLTVSRQAFRALPRKKLSVLIFSHRQQYSPPRVCHSSLPEKRCFATRREYTTVSSRPTTSTSCHGRILRNIRRYSTTIADSQSCVAIIPHSV